MFDMADAALCVDKHKKYFNVNESSLHEIWNADAAFLLNT